MPLPASPKHEAIASINAVIMHWTVTPLLRIQKQVSLRNASPKKLRWREGGQLTSATATRVPAPGQGPVFNSCPLSHHHSLFEFINNFVWYRERARAREMWGGELRTARELEGEVSLVLVSSNFSFKTGVDALSHAGVSLHYFAEWCRSHRNQTS